MNHLLVHVLCLSITLRVKADWQGPQQPTKLLQLCEMGPTVRHHIDGTNMKAASMQQNQLCRFLGRGELGQWYNVGHLAEAINNGQDNSVALQSGEACDKV